MPTEILMPALSPTMTEGTLAKWLKREDLKPVFAAERSGDVKHSLADLGQAKKILGYEPIVDFAAGLEMTMEWYRGRPV